MRGAPAGRDGESLLGSSRSAPQTTYGSVATELAQQAVAPAGPQPPPARNPRRPAAPAALCIPGPAAHLQQPQVKVHHRRHRQLLLGALLHVQRDLCVATTAPTVLGSA